MTGGLLGSGAATPIAGFLLGYPDLTAISTVINPDTDAYSNPYATYAQDDCKISQSAHHQLRSPLGISSSLPRQERQRGEFRSVLQKCGNGETRAQSSCLTRRPLSISIPVLSSRLLPPHSLPRRRPGSRAPCANPPKETSHRALDLHGVFSTTIRRSCAADMDDSSSRCSAAPPSTVGRSDRATSEISRIPWAATACRSTLCRILSGEHRSTGYPILRLSFGN